MEEAQRAQSSRRGHRAHLTKVLKRTEEIMSNENRTEMDIAVLHSVLEQLQKKKEVLANLDDKVTAGITDAGELETDIVDAEDIQSKIMETTFQVNKFFELQQLSSTHQPHTGASHSSDAPAHSSNTTSAPVTNQAQTSQQVSPQQPPQIQLQNTPQVQGLPSTSTETTSNQQVNVGNQVVVPPVVPFPNTHTTQSTSRLPKLSLPTFNGNSLNWQTFWDSFEAAVHSNTSLSGVQKFNYLKAQTTGDAARAIGGFPLTNTNYDQAVTLLRERFGQPFKVVNAHMQALLNIPNPTTQLTSLRQFYDTIESHIRGLFALGKSEESYGALLIPIVLGKLPVELQRNLAREHTNSEWTINLLRQAILKEVTILEAAVPIDHPVKLFGEHNPPSITASFHTSTDNSQFPPPPPPNLPRIPLNRGKGEVSCLYCNGKHHSTTCNVITDPQKRHQIVKKENRCFNCLGKHKVALCKSQHRCQTCKRKHHTSICTGKPELPEQPSNKANETQSQTIRPVHATMTPITPASINSTNINMGGTTLLLKTAIAPVRSPKFTTEANILFDEGAQRSFIKQDLVNQLQLEPKRRETICLSAFGATTPAIRQLDVVTVDLITETNESLSMDVLVVPEIATPLQNHLPSIVPGLHHLKGLKLAHPVTSDEQFEISLLIGVDYYWQLVQDEIVRGDGSVAVKSKLGYLLSGPVHSKSSTTTSTSILNVMTTHKAEEFDLERFWTVESLGISPPTFDEEKRNTSLEYQNTSITREDDGGYIAAFPWKKEHPPLPSNYNVCERRTRSLARRLAKSPHLLQTYGEIIADQENRGFIELVQPQENDKEVHYIPHHPIFKDSTTTPVRIVYDCSCRQSSNTPSLNDCLEIGPPLLTDMCSIILRARTHRFAFSTDIEKAFLHVRLNELDRNFTRFLWLSDPNDPESPFSTYHFKVVLFGSASSPFMLNATLHHHLDKYSTPVTEDMKKNLYVDNLISGCDSEADTIQYYEEARSIMQQGQFNLRSWATNSPQLHARVVQDSTNEKNDEVNILGLQWNPTNDKITVAQSSGNLIQKLPMTKRKILQQSAKVYDPLGVIAPVTVRARILMQELWSRKFPWDTPVDEDLQKKWSSMAEDIQESINAHATLPRQYFPVPVKPQDNVELHVFSDASTVAYGAVAYLRRDNNTSFVMAKARVAPLKKLTLPQLELMAALIGARLAHYIRHALQKRFNNLSVDLWSDSQIVLHWLNSEKSLKKFTENRVKEITQLHTASAWHYCPTSDNPADLLTRGITANQLQSSTIWRRGPHWLTSTSQWPQWSPTEAASSQTLATTCISTTTNDACSVPSDQPGLHHLIDVSQFTRLSNLIRCTAYVLRFVNNCTKRNTSRIGPLTTQELQGAEHKLIQNCQSLVYHKEIANLQSKSSNRLPLVRQLRLFLDASSLLRCGGRIHNAPLSEITKFPYLLPPKHAFTNLVIQAAHRNQLHAGVNSTVTAVRQKFWIPAARQAVKKALRRCVNCRKVEGSAYQAPDPAPLPKARIYELVPFKVTGVDFTGALYVNVNGSETKVYICLFTCAVSRAIHLEVVTDLTEETFIQAFRRFASRKSLPKRMISDNASTYLSAANELKQLFQSPSLKQAFSNRGVEWEFIPKRAPWYGGFWERLIGMTKTVIKKVLGRARISLIALETLVTEIEAVLNDRPLTYVSSDVKDAEPLTPAHLIYGRRITSLPYPLVETDEIEDPDFMDDSEARRRAKTQALKLQHFESRWKREYLTALREFHKNTGNNNQSVREGDVVLIHDDNPRIQWRMAVIESLIRGADGLVRAANIRTSTGRTNRPITKLYPLEITSPTETVEPPTETVEPPAETAEPPTTIANPPKRLVRRAAQKASQRISSWIDVLSGPPEDVEN